MCLPGSVSVMNMEEWHDSAIEPDQAPLADARSWFYFSFTPPAVLAGRRVLMH